MLALKPFPVSLLSSDSSPIEPLVASPVELVVVSPMAPTSLSPLIAPEDVSSEPIVVPSSSSEIHISPHPSNTITLVVDLPFPKDSPAKVFISHPILTRGKSGIHKPKALVATCILLEPKDYKDALFIFEWKASMQKEYDALVANET